MTVVKQSTENTVGRSVTSPVSATGFVIDNVGTNRCAFARIAYNANAGMSVTAVSYGGVAMTSCGAAAHNATSHAYVEWWYLVNPPTGSNTLAITVAGTIGDIYYNLLGRQNVNQTTPIRAGTYQATTGNSAAPGATITSNTNDLTETAINSGGPAINSTNQTLDSTIDNTGAYAVASDHCTTPAASVTHTWAIASAGQWALVGFSINGDTTVFPPLPVNSGAIAGRPIDSLGIDRPYVVAGAGTTGVIARTLPILSMAATGTVAIAGTSAKTLPILTLTSAGTVDLSGAVARTLPILTLASAGSVPITGAVARTLPILTFAATGTVPIAGTQTPSVPMLTMTSSGTETITGAVSRTLPILTLAMSSTGLPGTVQTALPIVSITSAGSVGDAGAIAKTLPVLALSAAGSATAPSILGAVTATLPMFGLRANDHLDIVLTAQLRVLPVLAGSFALVPAYSATLGVRPTLTGALTIRPQPDA